LYYFIIILMPLSDKALSALRAGWCRFVSLFCSMFAGTARRLDHQEKSMPEGSNRGHFVFRRKKPLSSI